MDTITPIIVAQQADVARAAGMVVGYLCGLIIVLLITMVFGALILQASFALYNALVNQPKKQNRIKAPSFVKSIAIIAATVIINAVITIMITFMIGVGTAALGADNRGAMIVVQLASNLVTYGVLAFLLCVMVPLPLDRAALVALLYYAISIALVVGVLLLVLAAMGGMPHPT